MKGMLFVLLSALLLTAGIACGDSQAVTVGPTETASTSTPAITVTEIAVTPSPVEVVKARILANPEKEYAYGDKLLKTTDQFQLAYIANGDYVAISLLSAPLSEARIAAEAELLQRSGNNLQGLCALRVNLGVPLYVQKNTEEIVEHPDVLDVCILGK